MVVKEIAEFEAPGTATSPGVKGSDDLPKEKKMRKVSLKINWRPLNALTGPLLIEAAAARPGDAKDIYKYTALE